MRGQDDQCRVSPLAFVELTNRYPCANSPSTSKSGEGFFVDFVERPNDAIDWSNTTLLVTADHSNGYIRFARTLNRGELPQESIDSESGAVSYPDGESSYSSEGQHTSELVNVYAKGFAASKLHEYEASYPGYGIMDDTATYALTLDAARR